MRTIVAICVLAGSCAGCLWTLLARIDHRRAERAIRRRLERGRAGL